MVFFLPVILAGVQVSMFAPFFQCFYLMPCVCSHGLHFKSGRVKLRSHSVKPMLGSELVVISTFVPLDEALKLSNSPASPCSEVSCFHKEVL